MKIAQEIGTLLKKKGWRLALAESCTGGALCDAITNVPGSSEYFLGGVVAYNNDLKVKLLEVRAATLKKFGAVSEAAAGEMARGVLRLCFAEVVLAVTGIAGGTVFVALATAGKTEVKHFCFPGDRLEFKRRVVAEALSWLKQELL